MFLKVSEYESHATDVGFKQASMTLVSIYPKWDNLDEYINAMYGWFQGEFDPTVFDQEAFQEIKREYGPGPVTPTEPVQDIKFMLYLPNQCTELCNVIVVEHVLQKAAQHAYTV